MGRVGGRRGRVVEEYRKWRTIVKKILDAKRKRKQQEISERLEEFRGRDEKRYWKYLKRLAGIMKKEERLPEVVQLGDKVGRKEVWNEAFSRLGKLDLDDKIFERQEYIDLKQKEAKWEEESRNKLEGELDHDIGMEELERALGSVENGKAAGEDGCINEILKLGGEAMKRSLLVLFQKVWKGGECQLIGRGV